MKQYIATFYTHLSAMRTERTMIAKQITAQLAPVPRALSASCGTCVRYSAESDLRECLDRDYEKVVEVLEADTYRTLLENH